MNAELRHLRYFVAVAEELHFTRAAARVHVAQQPLSAAIRRLEDHLGVALFQRSTRRVALTEAGAALLEPAREALRAADAAFATAQRVGRGEEGVLTIGISPARRYGVEPLLGALRRSRPRLQLRIRQESSRQLVEDVQSGVLDAGVGFCAEARPDVGALRLLDAPAIAAVAVDHPLATRASITLPELQQETFALADPREAPGYNAAVRSLCRGAGFEPRVRSFTGDPDAWETGVVEDGCIGLTDASAAHARRREVRILELTPTVTFPVDLLWRSSPAGRVGPAIRWLLSVAEDVDLRDAGSLHPPATASR